MNLLFPLPIRGVGTVDVESLGSYVHRLAFTHRVTARLLLSVTAERAHYTKFTKTTRPYISIIGLPAFVRPNKTNQDLVDLLTIATGNKSIQSTTFLALYPAISRTPRMFDKCLRWCPACMKEFENNNDPGYFKLIWSLRALVHCPVHGMFLIKKCPQCGREQKGMGRTSKATQCLFCAGSLSSVQNHGRKHPSWEHAISDLIPLISEIGNNPQFRFKKGGIKQSIRRIMNNARTNNTEHLLWKKVRQRDCIEILDDTMASSLSNARKIALQLGVNLVDFLNGEGDMGSDLLCNDWTLLPKDLAPIKRKRNRIKADYLEKTHQYLQAQGAEKPPALIHVAKHLGVSKGYLDYNFPTLANNIVETYRSWRSEQLLQNQLKARSYAIEFFTTERFSNERHSRKNALRILRAETGLPKNTLREAISETYRILYGE